MLRQLPTVTGDNVLVGTSTSDDAAVYKLSWDSALVLTVDFFPPIVDDPFNFGEISAANSLSDVYAMGGIPLVALNIVGFPSDLDKGILTEILKGGYSKAEEAGVLILGGHTVVDAEPKYGLAVTGTVNPGSQITNSGSKPGDVLILTKPIGTGIITTAGKQNKVSSDLISQGIEVMSRLNKSASEAMTHIGVNACSDVTGFGLLGHLREMVDGAGLHAEISLSKIPIIEGVMELIDRGIAPGGTLRNLESLEGHVNWAKGVSENSKILMSDAQTSGGLLISVPQTRATDLIKELENNGENQAKIIGMMTEHKKEKPNITVIP